MAQAIVLADAQAHLAAWMAADLAVSSGQMYMIGTRRLERAHAQEIRNNVAYWSRTVNRLLRGSNSGMRVRYGTVLP